MANKKVPKPASALKKNRFEFDLDVDGETKTFSLPKFDFLPQKVGRFLRSTQGAPVDVFVDAIAMINSDLAALLPDLESGQIDWITEEWAAASKVTPGESEASSS